MFRSENVKKLYESMMLQLKLEEDGYELIFFGEFSPSLKYHKHHGWSLKGKKGYLLTPVDQFKAFFVVAFSKSHFHGIKRS